MLLTQTESEPVIEEVTGTAQWLVSPKANSDRLVSPARFAVLPVAFTWVPSNTHGSEEVVRFNILVELLIV